MSFKKNDRVRINAEESEHLSKEGKIFYAYEADATALVELDGSQYTVAFLKSELKLLGGRDYEIGKIADALLEAEKETRWVRSRALETAASLYDAGVRYND